MTAEHNRARQKLRLLQHFCDYDAETLAECNDTIERILKDEQKRLEDWAEAHATTPDGEADNPLVNMYVDERHLLKTMLPQTLRRSLLVACCSAAEQYLKRLSPILSHFMRDSTTPEQMRAWTLHRHILYLKDLLGDKFPKIRKSKERCKTTAKSATSLFMRTLMSRA